MNSIQSFTGHGVSNIFAAESLLGKIVWSFFLIIFSVLCCYYIYDSFAGFFEFDVISNYKIYDVTELTFPAVALCGWFSDNPIADSIVFCTINKQDCQPHQIEPIVVIGYGLSSKHNCVRINGQISSKKNIKELPTVKQDNIFDAGISVGLIVPEGVRNLINLINVYEFFHFKNN